MTETIFALPVLFGLVLLIGAVILFRRETLNPRDFAIASVLSVLVIVSPAVYIILDGIKGVFGIVYTFVLGFGLAILLLIALVVYLVLSIGTLRQETEAVWQEIALLRSEYNEYAEVDNNAKK